MFLSKYFLPTLKNIPADANIVSHQLMLRAGMIRPLASGIYNWLPFGLRVLQNIESIIRQEMEEAGAIELLMPCIQPVSLWRQSGRFADGSDLSTETLIMKDRHDCELLFSPTAEEVICEIFKNNIQSYKDLPKNLYQIQQKFRDEIRPRYGIMRGREFLMKDSYSFDLDESTALEAYENMLYTYFRIFRNMGLKPIPVRANTGAIGGNYSHEIHILAETGESTIYYDHKLLALLEKEDFLIQDLDKYYAVEEEKHTPDCPVAPQDLCISKGIEVGHLFYLGTKYSSAMSVKIQNQKGELIHPHMGCYGIGVSRIVGAIIEANHDEKGIIWPIEVAPFHCIILNLNTKHARCNEISLLLYEKLLEMGLDIIIDDTQDGVGEKFARADLIGIPFQIIVGSSNAEQNKIELKSRHDGKVELISVDELDRILIKINDISLAQIRFV